MRAVFRTLLRSRIFFVRNSVGFSLNSVEKVPLLSNNDKKTIIPEDNSNIQKWIDYNKENSKEIANTRITENNITILIAIIIKMRGNQISEHQQLNFINNLISLLSNRKNLQSSLNLYRKALGILLQAYSLIGVGKSALTEKEILKLKSIFIDFYATGVLF